MFEFFVSHLLFLEKKFLPLRFAKKFTKWQFFIDSPSLPIALTQKLIGRYNHMIIQFDIILFSITQFEIRPYATRLNKLLSRSLSSYYYLDSTSDESQEVRGFDSRETGSSEELAIDRFVMKPSFKHYMPIQPTKPKPTITQFRMKPYSRSPSSYY